MLNHEAVAASTLEGSAGNSRLSKVLGHVIDACLYACIALVPLFFLPITIDVLELNKQTLLIILVLIGTTAWLGKALIDRHFILSRSWLHLVVILFALGWLVTSLFSSDRYMSLVGNIGQMQWSFATIAALVLFYFLVVNRVGTTKKLYQMLLVFLASSVLVGLWGLLQMFGLYPAGWLFKFTGDRTFNTIGTINALGIYMVVPMVLAASLTVFGCKDMECNIGKIKGKIISNVVVWLALVISVLVAVVVDFWVVWAGVLFGMVLLIVLPVVRSLKIHHPSRIAIPGVLISISILFLIFSTPIKLPLPSEVSPSATASWDIAKSVLKQSPVFGSGPGTWIYDYAKYRSPAVNLSEFWTVRFERGLSSFFTLMAMIGVVGMSLWIILLASAIVMSVMHLLKERDDDQWQAYLAVFVSWASVTFLAFFYNYNFAHNFAFWFFLALLAALVAKKAFVWDARKNTAGTAVVSVLFIMLCVAALSTAWVAGQRLAAEAAYSKAVMSYQSGGSTDSVIDSMNSAVALNRLNDVYYRNLSQAYLIKSAEIVKANKADANTAAQVNQIIAAAIDTAKRATEINPVNVDNWENLAVIYQSIAEITSGAEEFAIQNYQKALEYEPNNPVFSTEIGKIHLTLADKAAALAQSKDEAQKKTAEQTVKDELDKAVEAFNQAITAKADYAAAHYFLGLTYERQGRIKDAITKLEQVLSVSNKDVGVAFQLAILYYQDNDKTKAQGMFEQIVAFSPDYANARWYLSAIYEEQKDYQKALDQVLKVQETNKDNEMVTQRIAYLKDLIAKNQTGKAQGSNLKPVEEKISGPAVQNPIQQ